VNPDPAHQSIEGLDPKQSGSQKELANDVALLYSWAKMESAPYRDFARPPKGGSQPPAQIPEQEQEVVGQSVESNGSGNQDAALSATVLASQAPAHVAVDAPSPLLLAGLIPEKAMLVTHQTPAAQLPANQDWLPQAFTAIAAAGMQVGPHEPKPSDKTPPVLAVYSIAGGVGTTTLCANLGKALCSLGEQLLLVDASGRCLLPYYFGATDLRPGPRKFVAQGLHAPSIQVIAADRVTSQWLDGEVKPLMSSSQRTIFDLGPTCESLLPTILGMSKVVLVPLLPDLNSMFAISRIERALGVQSGDPRTPTVFYLFNRFNALSSNDQRAHDYVARLCGVRLLPIALRYSQELAETLQDGIPPAHPAPGPQLSHDYLELALWVRRVAPLSPAALLPGMWSEQ
jgi:cellulose biosynthesis protein BcsQ